MFVPPSVALASEVLTVVKMTIIIFWVETRCNVAGGYLCFRETYCLHIQVKPEGWRLYVPPK
jgi:hypothetical protein